MQKKKTSLLHLLMLQRYLLKPFNFMSSSSLISLLYQIPPKKASTQEQRSNNPTVEDDPVDADTQPIDSPTQQIIDGKKFIAHSCPSITNINQKTS